MGNKKIKIDAYELQACLHLLGKCSRNPYSSDTVFQYMVIDYLMSKYFKPEEKIFTADFNAAVQLVASATDIKKEYPDFEDGIPF